MSGTQDIRHIRHKDIDKKKWDQCIGASDVNLIYAHSYYLDIMSANWDALVYGDYQTVMPLTWNRKYGIHYLYQPFLTAQLGVFGKNITPHIVDLFIQCIPTSFRLVEISLNSSNDVTKHTHTVRRNNYTLNLFQSYEEIYNNYNENTKRNIKKAKQADAKIIRDFDVERVIELAVEQMKSYKGESAKNVDRFRKLYQHLHHNNGAATYGIESNAGQLISSAAFFKTDNRAYYILVGNNIHQKLAGASHLLIDEFIKDHSGRNMVLDFEGSDLPNLARFYAGFGAVSESYLFLKINRLPFYLKWIKK